MKSAILLNNAVGSIMNISKYFSDAAIGSMRREIEAAHGNEVFFTGVIDSDGVVVAVQVGARGTDCAVLVNQAAARECAVLIHNHPDGNLDPSEADMNVAYAASERAQGFYIIDNAVTNVYVVMEPIQPKELKQLDIDATALYLETGGQLSAQSELYEERPVQIALLKKIAESFNKNFIGVFEAGTGVGKSYAYLIPALLWASENKERVVISTGTINLQQQLCEKDIPAAKKIIGKNVKAVLVKGRQNYVCLRRLADAISERELFDEDIDMLNAIAAWAQQSETGSKSDLPFMLGEKVWSRIKSESDACMGPRCQHYVQCFVMKVRKEAATANVLVVNHHLLFADIESRMTGSGYDDAAVLPPYRRIIFDEAHGIENAATSFFSSAVNRLLLLRQLNLLYRKRRNSEAGYVFTLAILAANEEQAAAAAVLVGRAKNAIMDLETAANDLLRDEYTIRLCDKTARNFGPFLSLTATLAAALSAISALVKELLQSIAEEDKAVTAFWESKLIVRRLENAVLLLNDFSLWDEKRDFVFWVQKKYLPKDVATVKEEERQYVTFTKTPLNIAPLMNDGVFEPMSTVVCTSATLEINRDFSWWMKRSGVSLVDSERILFGDFPSPFPYEKNLLFVVPNDAPFPDDKIKFSPFAVTAVSRLIDAAHGRTLVLFTSYEMLRNTYSDVKLLLSDFNGLLLKQGDDDNGRMLAAFRDNESSVLFATDSFWQGVDVPGQSLSQVIIVKLPFSVPDDPVFAARSESVENRGGSAFMDLSMPEAVVKFRQGFGRLIRRSDDSGVVVVLDRRIYEKRYGRIFTNSIPETKCLYEPLDTLVESVRQFLSR